MFPLSLTLSAQAKNSQSIVTRNKLTSFNIIHKDTKAMKHMDS